MRLTVLFLAGTVLTGLIGATPTAHADNPNPQYRLVDTAAERLQTADPVAAFK